MDRLQFLALKGEILSYESPIYGEVKYTKARGKDKSLARRRATVPSPGGGTELDNERLEASLLVSNCVEPKFEPQDIDSIVESGDAGEVSKIAALIMGTASPKK